MAIRTKYGILIDDQKKVGECLAAGCPNKRNPDPCCFCKKCHPHHDIVEIAERKIGKR